MSFDQRAQPSWLHRVRFVLSISLPSWSPLIPPLSLIVSFQPLRDGAQVLVTFPTDPLVKNYRGRMEARPPNGYMGKYDEVIFSCPTLLRPHHTASSSSLPTVQPQLLLLHFINSIFLASLTFSPMVLIACLRWLYQSYKTTVIYLRLFSIVVSFAALF